MAYYARIPRIRFPVDADGTWEVDLVEADGIAYAFFAGESVKGQWKLTVEDRG